MKCEVCGKAVPRGQGNVVSTGTGREVVGGVPVVVHVGVFTCAGCVGAIVFDFRNGSRIAGLPADQPLVGSSDPPLLDR
jgi:hypothetical protein